MCWLSLGCAGQMGDSFTDANEEGKKDGGALARSQPPDAGAPDAAIEAAAPTLSADWLSNEAMLGLLRDGGYRGSGFRAVNKRAFPSAVSPGKTIALWVSEGGYDGYRQISSDHAGSQVHLPVGTVIVREVLDGTTLKTITAMLKLPQGAFPLGGDWWFASTAPDGTVNKSDDDGSPIIGLLEDCGTCHLRRNNDDYLFGTPDGYLN